MKRNITKLGQENVKNKAFWLRDSYSALKFLKFLRQIPPRLELIPTADPGT